MEKGRPGSVDNTGISPVRMQGEFCELQDMLIQALAIGDLVKMELYQIQSKILTIFQPSGCVVVWAKVPKLCNLCQLAAIL